MAESKERITADKGTEDWLLVSPPKSFLSSIVYPPISDCRSLLAYSIFFTINYGKQKAPLCSVRRIHALP